MEKSCAGSAEYLHFRHFLIILFIMNTLLKLFKDIPHLKVLGRVPPFSQHTGALHTFWTGSGFECAVKACEIWVEIESDYTVYESWVSVFINNAWISRFMAAKGKQWYCLARNLNAENIQHISVLKDTQAMAGDGNHFLSFCSMKIVSPYDNDLEIFYPIKRKDTLIEFVGDSITSGEGTIGAKCEMDWISSWFTCANTYAYMTSRNLNADFRIVSQSGWGVYCSWDNNITCALPLYYTKVCGLAAGEKAAESGAHELYNFSQEKADAVVINLGTNDTGSFRNPPWKDPETGIEYKQRTNDDGSFNSEDTEKITVSACKFLIQIREKNPDAKIIWAYGMLGSELESFILEAIERFKRTGGTNVFFVKLPNMEKGEEGSREHPGYLSHKKASDVLSSALEKILNTH